MLPLTRVCLSTANEVNECFIHFKAGVCRNNIPDWLELIFTGMGDTLMIRDEEVQRVFEITNAWNSQGPDNSGGRVLLKHCSAQLRGIYRSLFPLSLDT